MLRKLIQILNFTNKAIPALQITGSMHLIFVIVYSLFQFCETRLLSRYNYIVLELLFWFWLVYNF